MMNQSCETRNLKDTKTSSLVKHVISVHTRLTIKATDTGCETIFLSYPPEKNKCHTNKTITTISKGSEGILIAKPSVRKSKARGVEKAISRRESGKYLETNKSTKSTTGTAA